MNPVKKIMRNPLNQFVGVLYLISFINILNFFSSSSIKNITISFLLIHLSFLVYYSIYKFILKKSSNFSNVLISLLIIFLIIDPSNLLLIQIMNLLVFFLLKAFVRFKGKPVFNPVAIGVVMTSFVTYFLNSFDILEDYLFLSWWGADLSKEIVNINLVTTITSVLVAYLLMKYAKKFNKIKYALAFLFGLLIAEVFYLNLDNMLTTSIVASLFIDLYIFMVFIMVIEPKTSPIDKKYNLVANIQLSKQIILGIIFGILTVYLKHVLDSIEPRVIPELNLLLAILLTNILTILLQKT